MSYYLTSALYPSLLDVSECRSNMVEKNLTGRGRCSPEIFNPTRIHSLATGFLIIFFLNFLTLSRSTSSLLSISLPQIVFSNFVHQLNHIFLLVIDYLPLTIVNPFGNTVGLSKLLMQISVMGVLSFFFILPCLYF